MSVHYIYIMYIFVVQWPHTAGLCGLNCLPVFLQNSGAAVKGVFSMTLC